MNEGDIVHNPEEDYVGKIRELVWPDKAVIEPIRQEAWHLKIARHSILKPATDEQIRNYCAVKTPEIHAVQEGTEGVWVHDQDSEPGVQRGEAPPPGLFAD